MRRGLSVTVVDVAPSSSRASTARLPSLSTGNSNGTASPFAWRKGYAVFPATPRACGRFSWNAEPWRQISSSSP